MTGRPRLEVEDTGFGAHNLENAAWDKIVGVVEAHVRAVSGLGGVVGCFSPLPEEVWELGEGLAEKQEVTFLSFELWIMFPCKVLPGRWGKLTLCRKSQPTSTLHYKMKISNTRQPEKNSQQLMGLTLSKRIRTQVRAFRRNCLRLVFTLADSGLRS